MTSYTTEDAQKYEAVRKAILEAVPIRKVYEKGNKIFHIRPIELADVLRAIHEQKKHVVTINQNGRMAVSEPVKYTTASSNKGYPVHWVGCDFNLAKPLDEQPPEVISFLASVLCKK